MKTINTQEVVKNTLQKIIKNISIIAIVLSLLLILMTYLALKLEFTIDVIPTMAFSSVILCLSNMLIYELWVKNGSDNAREETEYQTLLKTYNKKSDGMNYDTLQLCIDHEEKRRYDVEYDRLTRIIDRDTKLLEKLEVVEYEKVKVEGQVPTEIKKKASEKLRLWYLKRKISRLTKARDAIVIKLPYAKSEEFDYLRYNLEDSIYKEYAPNDTKRYVGSHRTKKYVFIITFTMIGINTLSVNVSNGNILIAIFMTMLAAVSIISSLVTGFNNGYNSIKIVSTGVYKTANEFIDRSIAYCKTIGKDLYYKEPAKEEKPKEETKDISKEDQEIPQEEIKTQIEIT